MIYSNFFGGAFFGGGFFGEGVQVGGGGHNPSQGISPALHARGQTEEQKRKAREAFGIEPRAEVVIASVAQAQAERLELDGQKQFEELSRELSIQGIEWEARYLELLNIQRERLITAEIARLIRQKNDEEILILMLMAGAVA